MIREACVALCVVSIFGFCGCSRSPAENAPKEIGDTSSTHGVNLPSRTDDILAVGVPQIAVTEIKVLDNGTGVPNSSPRYSPDGKLIVYTRSGGVGSPPTMVIKDAVSLETVDQFEGGYRGAWSPDDNCISFCDNRKLGIYDRTSKKIFQMDYPGRFCKNEIAVWTNDSSIDFFGDVSFSFDLNSLNKRRFSRDEEKNEKEKLVGKKSLSSHPSAYIARDVGVRGCREDAIYVASKDDSYARILVKGKHSYVDVSPDFRSFIFEDINFGSNKLSIAYLGTRIKPPISFRIKSLDLRSHLNE